MVDQFSQYGEKRLSGEKILGEEAKVGGSYEPKEKKNRRPDLAKRGKLRGTAVGRQGQRRKECGTDSGLKGRGRGNRHCKGGRAP